MAQQGLTHIDDAGKPRMVDVSAKHTTQRSARAFGAMKANDAVLEAVADNSGPKGSVAAVATVAAISAAKRTADLIPLCHTLPLSSVEVDFSVDRKNGEVQCRSQVRCTGRTGVEMEALVAVHMGLLTVYDMCKAIDRSMEVVSIRLLAKSGGKHDFNSEEAVSR